MEKLVNLSDINTNTKEGRYLMAAIAKIATESQKDKTPDELMEQIYQLQELMFKEALPIPDMSGFVAPTFAYDIQDAINRYSKENGSNTPDFILEKYLIDCLNSLMQLTATQKKVEATLLTSYLQNI